MRNKINILEYFEETVRLLPEKIAVIDWGSTINFHDLFLKAKNLATKINQNDIINMPIAVYLPKSIESIIADIAITYSGNAYMNLDIKTPATRNSNILKRIDPKIIITKTPYVKEIRKISQNINIIILDDIDLNKKTDYSEIDEKRKGIIDSDPYCIINTSGSTGTPRGVVLNHLSFIDFSEWAIDELKIGDDEVIGSLSPLVFDIYSFELCMLMAKGSIIVILPDSLAAFPARILSLMQETHVSFIFWVPTIMVNIANMNLFSKMKLPDLKTVWFAGEVFPTMQCKYWKNNLSDDVKFVNLYGPIEITLDCTYFIIDRELKDDETIPIGFPCRNTDVLILNEQNQLAQKNEEGELCVRGTSLAMGYYNNPEKTAAAFVQNPLNKMYPETIYRTGDIVFKNDRGEIVFKGRKDSMVKHMGYRIELGEIEHVIINTLKLVQNGCVVYNTSKKAITLFYESKDNFSVAEMKIMLGDAFPKYMIPTVYHKLDALPKNANGKIDRLTLNME